MGANTQPIFSKKGETQWPAQASGQIVTANTTPDLTSGTSYLVFTADANGSFLQRIRFKATPAGNTTATVARIWLNNGSTTGTGANNQLLDEVTLPAITASATAATSPIDWVANMVIPAGYKIYVTIHTGSANGWSAVAIGGDY